MTDDNTPTGMIAAQPQEPTPPTRSAFAGVVFLIGLVILAGALVAQRLAPAGNSRVQPRREGPGSGWDNLIVDLASEVQRVGPSVLGLVLCVAGACFFGSRRRALRATAAFLLSAPVVVVAHLGLVKATPSAGGSGTGGDGPPPVRMPWPERADFAMGMILDDPVQRNEMATSILAITHPSGADPQLALNQKGPILDGGFMVILDLRWKGGLVGTDYQTLVRWDCNAGGTIRVTVPADDAPVGQDAASLAKLDEYFRSVVWPKLVERGAGP